jgi:hypothetical protein
MAGLLVTALLSVVVHNTASVPDDTLAAAKVNVERIYAGAGISMIWASGIEPGTFGIQVVLRRQPSGGPGAMAPSALGTTVGDDHRRGGLCFVFYERVLTFAHQHHRPVAVILAYAIAHEFGHVLLPAPAHASAGLMKAEWSDDDIRHLATDDRIFTPDQIALIRAAIEARRGVTR